MRILSGGRRTTFGLSVQGARLSANWLTVSVPASGRTEGREWNGRPQQEDALKRVSTWLKGRKPQVFRLFGFAGTGKTTLARHFAEGIEGEVVFGAFTGKAAHVLRRKAARAPPPSTASSTGQRRSTRKEPSFVINRDGGRRRPTSSSSTSARWWTRISGATCSPSARLCWCWATRAAPAREGRRLLHRAEPDVMLTEVHRQARDNPIIRLSLQVREGEGLELGDYGDSRVIRRAASTPRPCCARTRCWSA